MTGSLFDDCTAMLDRGWQSDYPNNGTCTVFNLTNYSSGESEVTVTTLHNPQPIRAKKKIDLEAVHQELLDVEPFVGKEAELVLMSATEPKVITDFDREENKQRSLRRTRSVIRKKVIEGGLDHLLTLTYQENKLDIKECWKDWKKFIRLVQKKYPTLKYLVILERQKRGAVHFHAAVHGYVHAVSLRIMWLSIVGAGNVDTKTKYRNQSLHSMGTYICKYLTKQYDELENFSNLYRCSRNIKLKQIKFYLSKEFALIRLKEIDMAIALFIKDVKQSWEDSNGLFSCRWASSLSP